MTKKPKLLMLKGLPASGKTTYARELVEKQGYVRVNKDDLRAMLDNGVWSKSHEKRVLRLRDHIIREVIVTGSSIVVDDTNFEPKHQESLSALAKEFGAEFEVMFIDTPLEECIKRNEKRGDKVPVSVIADMYDRHIAPLRNKEAPLYDENLEEAIIVDVDGTLAHINPDNPRNIYDADRALTDTLDDAVGSIVAMAYDHGYKVIILTGRGLYEGHHEVTRDWLEQEGVNYDELYSRRVGDDRSDVEIKEELYRTHIEGRFNVKYVIDDRPSVCRMWRSLGLKTLQVGDPHREF